MEGEGLREVRGWRGIQRDSICSLSIPVPPAILRPALRAVITPSISDGFSRPFSPVIEAQKPTLKRIVLGP